MISRRRFFGLLGAVPFLGAASGLKKPAGGKILMNRFSIAGFQYYDGPQVIGRIRSGDRLTLKAEPANPYDEFAVEIFYGKTKLGYIPRSDNRHISRLLLGGGEPVAEVEYAKPEGSGWKAVKANVYLKLS